MCVLDSFVNEFLHHSTFLYLFLLSPFPVSLIKQGRNSNKVFAADRTARNGYRFLTKTEYLQHTGAQDAPQFYSKKNDVLAYV
jgi:hypothetical protein